MAYDLNKVTKLLHIKTLMEKIKETFATKTDVASSINSVYSNLNSAVSSIVSSQLSDFHNTISSEINGKIQAALSTVYKIKGSKTFAQLTQMYSYIPSQAIPSIIGEVYNITDAFTTTDLFVEGAGKEYPAGTNVVIVANGSDAFKFDVL